MWLVPLFSDKCRSHASQSDSADRKNWVHSFSACVTRLSSFMYEYVGFYIHALQTWAVAATASELKFRPGLLSRFGTLGFFSSREKEDNLLENDKLDRGFISNAHGSKLWLAHLLKLLWASMCRHCVYGEIAATKPGNRPPPKIQFSPCCSCPSCARWPPSSNFMGYHRPLWLARSHFYDRS